VIYIRTRGAFTTQQTAENVFYLSCCCCAHDIFDAFALTNNIEFESFEFAFIMNSNSTTLAV